MRSDTDRLERLRHDVRAFFIYFFGGTVVWIIIVSAASYRSGGSFLFPLGVLLFGIPRVLASSAAAAVATNKGRQIEPNTNLEQISDWLTKVLVGVGLTELGKIDDGVKTLSAGLDTALPKLPAAGPVSVATIIALGSAGFPWVYFECRTSIFMLFDEEEDHGRGNLNAAVGAEAIAGTISGAVAGAATGAAQAPDRRQP